VLLVMVGWVFFRATGLGQAFGILRAMFWPRGVRLENAMSVALNHQRLLVLALASTVVLLPPGFVLGRIMQFSRGVVPSAARVAAVFVAAPYAAMLVAAGTFSPFLYYQF
jgi:alginate O-acetyltransferase complex protein AlgI